jgi:hypothetical protein
MPRLTQIGHVLLIALAAWGIVVTLIVQQLRGGIDANKTGAEESVR